MCMVLYLFVTGASRQVLDNLKICSIHFPEDMLIPYASQRRLKECALPTLYLPLEIDIAQDNVNTIFNNVNIDNLENEHNPDLSMPSIQEEISPENQVIHIKSVNTLRIHDIRNKLRRVKKMLSKKKKIIQKQREKINRLHRRNKWEEITKDLSAVQRIFFDMLSANLYCAPQVFPFTFIKS